MDYSNISIFVAFSAGFLSFVSPCVLPLVPSFVTYITGLTFEDITSAKDKSKVRYITITNSLAFIGGFSSVFVLLGASATFLGETLLAYQNIIQKIGGVLIVLLGLYIMGVIKLNFLSSQKKFHIENKPAGFIGSFLVGMAFAAGWTPCVGPILGSILLYASTTGSMAKGMGLLAVYSLGLGVPFFISALAINTFIATFKVVTRYMKWINIISGAFLILIGIMIFTDSFSFISTWFQKYGIGWSIEL
ncbi:MAG: sulfite exporter TauE/SafE family protein [Nitrospirae bacterium]|nr:sulfite exporter TauE/SafE family protein [Nitrospirota bacterium]